MAKKKFVPYKYWKKSPARIEKELKEDEMLSIEEMEEKYGDREYLRKIYL